MRLAPTPRAPRLTRSLVIAMFYGALALVAIVWAALRGDHDLYRLPNSSTARLAMSPFVGVAFGLAVVFFSRLAVHRFEWARTLHREFHAIVHEFSSREIVLLAVASSLGEEMFFRGALLPQIGLYGSTALFAMLHVRPQLRFLPWTLMSFVLGLAMGVMYMELGDLGGPIAAHFVINLLNLNYIARTELA